MLGSAAIPEINHKFMDTQKSFICTKKREVTALPTHIPNYMKPNAAAMQRLGKSDPEHEKELMD
jgi:hypothetical protein